MIPVFSAAWFLAHQRRLLWWLNAPIVRRWCRWLLCIRRQDVGYDGRIVLLLPHAYVLANADGSFTADIRTHAKYAKRLYYGLRPFWQTLHAWDALVADRWCPAYSAGFFTLTAFPASNAAAVAGALAGDGFCYRDGINETFATIRAGAGTGAANNNAIASVVRLIGSATTSQFKENIRGCVSFDTSLVGTIVSATLSVYSASAATNLGTTSLVPVSAAPASARFLVAGDYDTAFGATAFATAVGSAAWIAANETYVAFTLNSTGLAAINTSGVTSIGFRHEWDRAGSFTGTWVANDFSSFDMYFADETGTAKDPTLVVTFTGSSRVGQFDPGAMSKGWF